MTSQLIVQIYVIMLKVYRIIIFYSVFLKPKHENIKLALFRFCLDLIFCVASSTLGELLLINQT